MMTVSSILLTMTAVSGIVDAVCFIALGHVFTANMTGNVVFLGFAIGGAPGLSIWRFAGTSMLAYSVTVPLFVCGVMTAICALARLHLSRKELSNG